MITNSAQYKEGGALIIVWDEAEDSGAFSDGPIGMFILSPFAKGCGKKAVAPSEANAHQRVRMEGWRQG